MSESNNPFIRGYRKLRIVRTLLITCEDDEPPVWRMLHPSQAHLPDNQLTRLRLRPTSGRGAAGTLAWV